MTRKMKSVLMAVAVFILIVGTVYISHDSSPMGLPTVSYGIADQVAQVMPSVVHIEKEGVCQGSGCIIAEDGLIFTAKHVTEGGGKFIVTLNDGRKFETSVAVEDKDYDIAFLKIDVNEPLPMVKMADYNKTRIGDGVFVAGSPYGDINRNSVSLGILSARQRNLDARRDYGYGWKVLFQSDAAANPGNSGGPVFNMLGEVIGVLVAGMSEGVNYSVPVAVFMDDIGIIRSVLAEHRFEIAEKKGEAYWPGEYGGNYVPGE